MERSLRPLRVGDNVRIQPSDKREKVWKEATVAESLPNRSYTAVDNNGREHRRNRRHLRARPKSTHDETPGLIRLTCRSVMPPPAIEHSISQANTTTQSPIQSPARPEPMSPAQQHSEQLPYMNRYGRIIKPPFRFQE